MDKKLLFRSALSLLSALFFLNAQAAIHVVQVLGGSFSPNTMSVNVGDTVRWTFTGGSHTTTSTSVPGGAATWDSPINSGTTSFDYKVTVAGTYNYKCTPHNFTGIITASSVTGIQNVFEAAIITSLYPNPFTNELFIEQGNENPEYTQISISDILGKQIKNIDINALPAISSDKRRIDVSELPKGIYFVTLKGNGTKAKTIRLVKEGA